MTVHLPSRLLHGLEDAQINFEWIETHWGGGSAGSAQYVAQVTRSSAASVALTANAPTKIPLDSTVFDTSGFADNANARLTVPAGMGGYYEVTANGWVNTPSNPGVEIAVGIYVNGAPAVQEETSDPQTVGVANMSPTWVGHLNPGDYVELFVTCFSAGGSYQYNVTTNWLAVVRIGAGPAGPAGSTGPAGPTGPPGSGGDLTYVHNQVATAATWNVTHNLGKFGSVTVVDSGNSVLIPDVSYVDANHVTLNFGAATSGRAFVN
jgi:hypothetical protein